MTAPDLAALVTEVRGHLDTDALTAVARQIHGDPELGFAEHRAAALLTGRLAAGGFDVESGVAGLPTAFRARRRFGAAGPTVALFCEYDALPGLGHACGHNIIATAGLGGGLAAASAGAPVGELVVLGSPAEEGGGGKVRFVEAGVLDDVDAAIMVHPAGYDAIGRTNLGRLSLRATFTGRASHASAAPEEGRNALDAATLLLTALGLLRQQLRADSRVHANVVDGGQAINVIPERAVVSVFVRSPDVAYLRDRLHRAVQDAVAGCALATGTTGVLEEVAPAYEPVRHNPVLAELTAAAYAAVGRPADATLLHGNAGSTDMGNVSQRVPALHPYVQVVPGATIHTREFADVAGGDAGDRAALDGAAVLGAVALALLRRPELVAAARAAHDQG
ncbi:amidohydrolase [Jatrophihabitans endophyticus]|uniref:Peptidase M20 domain-containing protein 2 n=1 Tax=Jatrophihabitans endophyticus TaxID=1206085 RepID=A0A1M5S1X2_9ACTN|nr:M20 family metallopeptidase [Jatrophihabitans endophyticus]SHH32445.1 amidohydrolase [Jatrophihabitans endophyticus]